MIPLCCKIISPLLILSIGFFDGTKIFHPATQSSFVKWKLLFLNALTKITISNQVCVILH